jgi:hypothetical protein
MLSFGMLHGLVQDPGVSIKLGLMVKASGFCDTALCTNLIKSYLITEGSNLHNTPNLSFD